MKHEHSSFRIEVNNFNRFKSICTCGWDSQFFSTSGLAGAAWDEHVKEHLDG